MRRLAARKIDHHFVHITPAPPLWWIVPLDYGMSGLVKVLGRMAVRRIVTTPYMPANAAESKVHPLRPHPQALFAPQSTWGNLHN
jgi:hypothetical protein